LCCNPLQNGWGALAGSGDWREGQVQSADRPPFRCMKRAGPHKSGGKGMGDRDWVKAIGKKLREDLGDCPVMPQELLDVLRKLDRPRDGTRTQVASPKRWPQK
jgi:hypothetical protein